MDLTPKPMSTARKVLNTNLQLNINKNNDNKPVLLKEIMIQS